MNKLKYLILTIILSMARLPHGLLLRKYAPSRQSQAEMVALEGLKFQI